MPLFQEIAKPMDLPQLGQQAERHTLDIKADYDSPFDKFELAKDIAALANVTGGVILVGAAEDRKRGTVGRYKPLPEARVKELRDAFSEALRDLCAPAPVMNAEIIPKDGGFVLAVNVWPFPGQAVGVLRDKEPRTYAFPIRTAVDTRWLTSEQLPMLMVAELRRIMILVDAIPSGTTIQVVGRSAKRVVAFDVIEASPLENVLKLRTHLEATQTKQARPEFNLPLDVIRSVWRDAGGIWRILVDGDISVTGDGSATYTSDTF